MPGEESLVGVVAWEKFKELGSGVWRSSKILRSIRTRAGHIFNPQQERMDSVLGEHTHLI